MDVGIIGLGTMGRALAQGLLGDARVKRIVATTGTPRSHYPELPDVIAASDNRELAGVCDVVIFCIKPSQMRHVARQIAGDLRAGTLLVSVAAGVTTDAIGQWTGEAFPIVRAMPNMPCRIGAGMTALAARASVDKEGLDVARAIFATLGRVVVVEERLMDAVTAISGCGPAYVYLMIEALAEAGVSLGLPRATALELAAQTLHGAAAMVLSTNAHPAALKDEVTTPAGCTIDGLLALEDGKLRSTLVRAVTAAAVRSATLGASAAATPATTPTPAL